MLLKRHEGVSTTTASLRVLCLTLPDLRAKRIVRKHTSLRLKGGGGGLEGLFADLEAQLNTPGSELISSLEAGDVVGVVDSVAPAGAAVKGPLQREVPIVIVSSRMLLVKRFGNKCLHCRTGTVYVLLLDTPRYLYWYSPKLFSTS